MHTILVTGANRGIGLGLVRELLAISGVERVYATTRCIDKSTDLSAIKDERLRMLDVDINDDESIQKVAKQISSESPTGIDLLINNAGVLNVYTVSGEINRAKLNEQLEVNCTSQFILTQIMLPLLRLGATSHGSAWVVNIGSAAGSLSLGIAAEALSLLPYSMSKAALNMFSRVAAAELDKDNIHVVTIHPGWVQTEMGNSWGGVAPMTDVLRSSFLFPVDESVKALASSLQKLNKEQHNGGFFDRNLEPVPY